MLCKWCGMESMTTDQCSWCHRSLTTSSEASESETSAAESAPEAAAPPEAEITSDYAESPLGTLEEPAAPKAPWTVAPPMVTPSPPAPTGNLSAETGTAPIIGIRRAGPRPGGAHIPAPAMPPPSARASGHGGARKAPAAPGVPTSVPPAGTVPGATQSVPIAAGRPASPAQSPGVPTVSTSRPAVPAALRGGTSAPTAQPAITTSLPAATGGAPVASGGLAEGVAAPNLPAPTSAPVGVPPLGTFQPAKSKYYSDKVVDPISGTHYDADTGQPVAAPTAAPEPAVVRQAGRKAEKIKLEWDQPAMGPLIARHLGIYALILAVAALFTYVHPQTYLIPMILAQTVGALLLPILHVAPWADEDADDVWFLLLFLLVGGFVMACGPALALAFYIVLAVIKQNANPAVMGCLIVALLARLTVEAVTGHLNGSLFVPYNVTTHLNLLLVNWSALTTAAGWYAASMFHKLDE